MIIRLLSLLSIILASASAISAPTPRQLLDYPFIKDANTGEIVKPNPVVIQSYAPNDKRKARDLSLFDISNAVYKVASDRNLKIASQKHGPASSEYNLESEHKGQYQINVDSFNNQFEFTVTDTSTGLDRKSKVPNRSYMTNEFSTFVTSAIDSFEKRERRLRGSSDKRTYDICQTLVDALSDNNEFSNRLTTKSGTNSPCDVYIDNILVFHVDIVKKGVDSFLVISNAPTDVKFTDFDLNHFEFRHSLLATDTSETLKDYLNSISITIGEKVTHIANPSENIKLIYNICLEGLGKDFNLIAVDELGLKNDSYVTFDIHTKDTADAKIAEIQIYPIKRGSIYGLSVIKANEAIDMTFVPKNLESSVASSIKEIINLLKNDQSSLYDLDVITVLVQNNLGSNNCILINKDDHLKSSSSGFFELDDAQAKSCEAKSSVLKLSLFAYGYMQYLHIAVDNDLLRDEFMIAINSKFHETLNSTLVNIINVIKEVRQNKEKALEIRTIDFEAICEDIKAKLGQYTCENKNDIFECVEPSENGAMPVLMIYKTSPGLLNEYYRVTFLTKRVVEVKSKLRAHVKEVSIPKTNNSDIVEGFMMELERYFTQKAD